MQPPAIEKDVTHWLQLWHAGDDLAIERVTEMVYRDLKKLAAYYLETEREGHTLQPTALVHEAFLHLSTLRDIDWKARSHFVAVMTQMMRRILIDHARKRAASKREPEWVEINDMAPRLDILVVDQALVRLAAEHPRHAKVVEMRFFGGLSSVEIAQVLDVSLATIERDWRFARAWLQSEMAASSSPLPGGTDAAA